MAERRYDDYEARLEAKRKDDEKRWRDLQYQLSVGSPMGQTNKAIEAQQMLGQISGAGGTKAAAAPFPSWMNTPTAGPRPMMTPEQREAQSRVYEGMGKDKPAGGRGSAEEDERKRLEAMLKMLYAIPTLTPQQEKMRIETERRWSALSGQPIPEGVAGSLPEKKSAWERFKGLFTSDDEEVRGGLQGLE